MKKLISLFLALMMVLSLATVAFADNTASGSITINGIHVSEDGTNSATTVYEIYRLLDLESYDTESGAYSYKVNENWTAFFATDDAKTYFTVDEQGYATWIAGEDDAAVAAFAKKALAYAKANKIAPVKSSENSEDFVITNTSGKFSNLPLGYYLVDSTVGALCGLTTTNPNASINAKNGKPTVDKQVKEDSTNQYGSTNTADIGQIVEFRTTINVHAGAENYVLHDDMSNGLTFEHNLENNRGVVEIRHVVPGTTDENGTVVPTTYYTVKTSDFQDECEFEVHFTQDFCNHLKTNDKIIVYYNAMLNKNAIIAGEGNPNETWLEYGEEHYTTHDETKTYTFGFDVIKTDSQNVLLNGAEFRIYDAAEGGSEVGVVLMDDGVTYRRARPDEQANNETKNIVVKDGKVRVVGFDNGTYYLQEVVTPEGYNQLASRKEFIISDSNLDAIFNDGIYSTGSGVHVVNKSGSMLPETGAMGTTLFFTIGVIVMLATGALLVTKKRLSMIED